MPKLFAVFDNDRVVPAEFGLRLYEAAPEPKRLVELNGNHDLALVDTLDGRRAVLGFLDAALPPAGATSGSRPK